LNSPPSRVNSLNIGDAEKDPAVLVLERFIIPRRRTKDEEEVEGQGKLQI
jgi:hypothetical protein